MKLWGGRFRKETDSLVNDFNASIHFDARLCQEDIQGSMAHARMLSDCGIISPEDNRQIQEGLAAILADVEAGRVAFTADNEDIHMNVEALLLQAPAHRPQPQRSGGRGPAAAPAPGDL